jgi:hypothetical protein
MSAILAVAEGHDLVALLAPVGRLQAGRGDDHVLADLGELGFGVERLAGALLELKLQDLTGLVRAASGGRLFPPEVSAGDASPLGVGREQRSHGAGVSAIERLGCCA